MVTVDRSRNRATVRIVFDGPAMAGKSTNVTQIPPLFPAHRRGEVVTPHPTGGRTDYFDFLEVRGGSILGLELYGQFLSVPGQDVLFHRRRFLLRDADCIVFVCAATDAGLVEARRSWRDLQRILGGLPSDERPQVIVQVNKLDLARPGARERILGMLGVPDDVPAIGASAATGEGVRETVVTAFRVAADRAQQRIRAVGAEATSRGPTDANSLLIEMQLDSERPRPESYLSDAPVLPRVDTSLDRVWPPQAARLILHRALASTPTPYVSPIADDDSGTWVFEAGLFRLATSTRWMFPSVEAARDAMKERARLQASLHGLAPRNQAFAIAPCPDGRFALWTVGPWYTNLRDQLLHAARRVDVDAFEDALLAYARGVLAAMRLALDGSLVLTLTPESFAAVGASVYYVRDGATTGTRLSGIVESLVATLGDDARFVRANESFIGELETGFSSYFDDRERRSLGLEDDLASCTVLTATADEARSRWLDAVRSATTRQTEED